MLINAWLIRPNILDFIMVKGQIYSPLTVGVIGGLTYSIRWLKKQIQNLTKNGD